MRAKMLESGFRLFEIESVVIFTKVNSKDFLVVKAR